MKRSLGVVALAVAVLAASAQSVAAQSSANPWLERRVIDLAHQGGEWEAPSNTIYAFRRAVRKGADMLELDVHSTADGRLVVIHDATVDRTTDGSGYVSATPWARLKRLDAAYNFVPGRNAVRGLPESEYPLRGVRTGERRPPGKPGRYRRRDFRIPLLGEVFRRFPNKPINIEIKGDSDGDLESFQRTAELLAAFLNQRPERAHEVIVVSFNDAAVARFSELAPAVGTAPGLASVAVYFTTSVPPAGNHVAIQIPVQFEGVPVATPGFIARAHADGFAVHIFPDHEEESDELYRELHSYCVDGIMTAYPSRYEAFLVRENVFGPGRPDGVDPCG
ncbi:MAG: glycerophosphodiester phosphodiesterase [Solirubrobacterales bacterium]